MWRNGYTQKTDGNAKYASLNKTIRLEVRVLSFQQKFVITKIVKDVVAVRTVIGKATHRSSHFLSSTLCLRPTKALMSCAR